jgi:hypothetical protein
MSRTSLMNSKFEHTLRDSFTVSNANRTSKVKNIQSVKLVYTSHGWEFRWNKRYKVLFLTTLSPFMRKRAMDVHMHG